MKAFPYIFYSLSVMTITLCIIIVSPKQQEQQPELLYYQHKADSLQCRIYEWENHAMRMKRIAGVPDSVAWSYATKCVYSIDTKKVLRK
jgi:hypothetical protein